MTTPQETLFIVDADKAMQARLAEIAQSMSFDVECFLTAEQFLEVYDGIRSGCLVTEIRLLGMNGLQLLEELVRERNWLPAVVLTALADVRAAVRAMRAGALTVLEKPSTETEIRRNVREGMLLAAQNRQMAFPRREIKARMSRLAPIERRVMRHMMAGNPNKVIAASLDIAMRTVEKYRRQVFQAMGVDSLAELVRLVLAVEPSVMTNSRKALAAGPHSTDFLDSEIVDRKTTILLIGDEPTNCWLNNLCAPLKLRIAAFRSAQDFLNSPHEAQSGCLVAYLDVLEVDPLEFLWQLEQRHITVPVIVLGSQIDVPMAVCLMRAGAADVLTISCPERELWDSIRDALKSDSENCRLRTRQSTIWSRIEQLSPRERRVMKHMLSGEPNKRIAKMLNAGLRTIEADRRIIMKKMQTSSLAELVRLFVDADLQEILPPLTWRRQA